MTSIPKPPEITVEDCIVALCAAILSIGPVAVPAELCVREARRILALAKERP